MMGYLIIIEVVRKQCNHVFFMKIMTMVMMAIVILVVIPVVRREGGGVMVIMVIKFINRKAAQSYPEIAYCVPLPR